jgi:hypothetical protein
MSPVQYGVVEQDGVWVILGDSLRFGSYSTREDAEAAARALASKSSGLPVDLHVQDDTGELKPAERL